MTAPLKHHPGPLVALAALGAVALSCAPSTHIVAAWKDPQVERMAVERPLVVFQQSSEVLRRTVEDAIVEGIPGAVAAYQVIPEEEVLDVEDVKTKLGGAVDSVIITRLVDVRQEWDVVAGVPRPFYYPFDDPLWGAWPYDWSDVAAPADLEETTVVVLESLVYSLDPRFEGELIWASRSETIDPFTFESLAESVARASVKAMEKEGFVVGTGQER